MSKQDSHKPIGEILIDKGLITREQLDEALAQQKDAPDEMIGEILVRLNHISLKDVIQAYAEQVLSMYDEQEESETPAAVGDTDSSPDA